MRTTKHLSLSAAAVFALAASGCAGDDAADSTAAAPQPSATSASASPSAAMAQAAFGDGCAAVPTDASNPGSFQAMAKEPVATAASGNPLLKTLVTAVKQANLVDSLNTAPALTVFAPVDSAFAKIPKADLDKVLADNKTLTSILTYHVVSGKLAPQQLAGSHKTLQGGDVTVAGSGTSYTVNGNAMVVCGNVQTANATVYIVDTVLMPKS